MEQLCERSSRPTREREVSSPEQIVPGLTALTPVSHPRIVAINVGRGSPDHHARAVQAMMDVFQLLDNNPLLGHYRVKMALDALGYRYGHTTVWQMVALDTQAHPRPTPPPHTPRAEERPLPTTAPHQVWCIDVRYLVKIDGHWLYSILLSVARGRSGRHPRPHGRTGPPPTGLPPPLADPPGAPAGADSAA